MFFLLKMMVPNFLKNLQLAVLLVHVVKVEKRAPLFSPPLLPNITSSKLSQEVRISIVPIFCFY